MAHKLAEPYSGKNPVPKIATKLTSLINPKYATEAKAAQLQDQSSHNEEKQTEKRASRLAKGYVMHVVDPVTGEELDIKNADEELDVRNRGENVLENDFPPPDWREHRHHVSAQLPPSILAICGAYCAAFMVARLISDSWISTALAIGVPSLLAYTLLFRANRISAMDFEDRVWHSERVRGLQAGSDWDGDGRVGDHERTKESAEWANAVLRGVWPIMNTDLFGSVIDMVEDIMQTSIPSFIDSVRIADLGLGSNAARITSIRSLPDAKPREEVNDQDQAEQDPAEQEQLEEQHVNVELSFAYRGLPSGRSAKSKARNIHLLVEFFLGFQGWYGFKVPVWVEITGAIGTARARLQLISDPPFVKTTMVTLLGLPRITISVIPMNRILPNVMNLPFISGFISSSIDTAVAEYVAPRSITLDLQRLISGDDIKKDTDAIGVIVVHIHKANDVKRADVSGGSDPYVTLTYSKLGKPLYSTRIIKADCNPIFEETAVVLVDVNTIRLREKLSFQLWDSDRMSVDDLLGIAEVDVVALVRDNGEPRRCVAKLTNPHSKHTPGTLEYTVGYYAKRPPTTSLKSNGIDPGIPEDLQKMPEFQNARSIALDDLEAAVLVTPPDPEWPSGIVSIQVHEVRGLGVKTEGRETNVVKTPGHSREGEKGQDEGGQELEEGEGLPSSYCMVSVNDELVYRTRVKPITSTPIFNAGTERFVRDWRAAHVAVTVKDSRIREKDAVLGVVMLKLSDLLVNSSQITRLWSLEQGLGYGRIRLSLLFHPVEAKLPTTLLGFDTGTLEIKELSAEVDDSAALELVKCRVRLKTTKSNSAEKVSRRNAQRQQDGRVVWAEDGGDLKGIPVRMRYGSALLMSFKDGSSVIGLKRTGRKALAMLWLRDITDNDEQTVEIPLYTATDGDYSRLKRNYTPPSGDLGAWDADKEKLQRIGTVVADVRFNPGISELHRNLLDGGGAKRKEAWEAFVRERDGGLRDSVGDVGGDARIAERRPENLTEKPRERGEADRATRASSAGAGTHAPQGAVTGRPEINTMVSSQAVENASIERHPSGSSDPDSTSDSGGDRSSGVIAKIKQWRDHGKELHRDHRGLMQAKPARTADWIKDSVEESVHHVKDRFSMKARKPDVETEV